MIRVHEFTTMNGVIDEPQWTLDFGFDPKMSLALANAMGGCDAILLGRVTHQMFEPAWSIRTAEDDPGAPFMNDSTKYVVSTTLTNATWRNSEIIGAYDPAPSGSSKTGWTAGFTSVAAQHSGRTGPNTPPEASPPR